MSFKKITAIVRLDLLHKVEHALKELGVPGVSISQIKGYGEYANLYAEDGMVEGVRVEVFIDAECTEAAVQAIMQAAHTGLEGDGIVAVTSVEQIYHIRTKELCEKKPC